MIGTAEIRTRVTSSQSWKDAKLPYGPLMIYNIEIETKY